MKREEKNALSRQRILDAAMEEFSRKGYAGASLNTVCAEKGISKGIIYHHFKDKDELYLLCIKECFDAITSYLEKTAETFTGSATERLQAYFDARLCFFAEHPLYLGIFADATFHPPGNLADAIADSRKGFDDLNISILTNLLQNETLREELSIDLIVEDFRIYMDYFHMRFRADFAMTKPSDDILHEYEEKCHRQLDILLHGVLGEKNAK